MDTRTGEQVVIKQVSIVGMSEKDVKASRKEAVILSRMDHPSIIKGLESFEADGQLCIVTDFAANGDMVKAVERQKGRLFPEETILDWLAQLCLALLCVSSRCSAATLTLSTRRSHLEPGMSTRRSYYTET